MAWDPKTLIRAAKKAGVEYEVDSTWLDVDPYPTSFRPVGLVLHHTACNPLSTGNAPSLNWCRNPGIFTGKARACHILMGRNGKLFIIAGKGAYHAGAGGPMTIDGTYIPKNLGNRYLIGMEIEASSTNKVNSKNVRTPKWNMNPAQYEAMVKYSAALMDETGWDISAIIRHKDWAPTRKVDIGLPLLSVRADIKAEFNKLQPPPAGPLWDGVVPDMDNVIKAQDENLANLAAYRLAARLYDLGSYTGEPPVKYEQGYPKRAVADFQTTQGWKGTGTYGPKVHARIFDIPVPTKPTIKLVNVQPQKTDPDVGVVRTALEKEFGPQSTPDKENYFGRATKAQYKKWQQKLGYSGTDADGVPGKTSLTKLGRKYGFTVR